MTPAELAAIAPRLYHVTTPGASEAIAEHGLLSTSKLLDLFEIAGAERDAIESRRRGGSIPIEHPAYGRALITDNLPLSEQALERCLDDGLTPRDWLHMLNSRVFFWPDEAGLRSLLDARVNRSRSREVLVFQTQPLAQRHADRIELSPINSGSTIRRPARRGLATFTPMLAHSYAQWQQLRGGRDRIREIVVRDAVPDAADFLINVWQT